MDDQRIPDGLYDLLRNFIIAVLQEHPSDLITFGSLYFQKFKSQTVESKNNEAGFKTGITTNYTTNISLNLISPKLTSTSDSSQVSENKVERYDKLRTRKPSISAELCNSDDDDDEDNNKSDMHQGSSDLKTDVELERLVKLLRTYNFMQDIPDKDMHSIKESISEVKVFSGEVIINEGEEGDKFYLIESGKYEVKRKNTDGSSKAISMYDDQGYFGELALMYNSPRSATITAVSEGVLWTMSRNSFRKLILASLAKYRKHFVQFLNSVDIIIALTSYEKSMLADALVERQFPPEQCIIREGEPGSDMFFLMSGSVRVTKQIDKSETEITKLSKGKYFGELALLRKQPQVASIYSITPITVAVLRAKDFDRLLENCREAMELNFEKVYKNV